MQHFGKNPFSILMAVLIIYLTTVSIAKLLGIESAAWAEITRRIAVPYDFTIGAFFQEVREAFMKVDIDIPIWVRDALTIWIILGRLVRRAISDIVEEEKILRENVRGESPQTLLDGVKFFFKNPYQFMREWLTTPATKEAILYTLFPLWRIWVDLRGDYLPYTIGDEEKPKYSITIYWEFSPKTLLLFLTCSVVILGLIVGVDYALPTHLRT